MQISIKTQKFCPDCGAAAETVTSPDTEAAPAAEKTDFSEKISQLNNTADTTADYDAADIQKKQNYGCSCHNRYYKCIERKNKRTAHYREV